VDLVPILQELGIRGLRQRGNEISGLCPGHYKILGREDSHASWGINADTGLHQCFSCGYRGTIVSLYADITGDLPSDELMGQAALGTLFTAVAEEEETIEPEPDWYPGDLVDLSSQMLQNRFLTLDATRAYGVFFDRSRSCIYVPIVSEDGELLGAQYKQLGGVSNLPPDVPKSHTLFGLDQARGKWTDVVALVESPLDVVRLHVAGIPAVSSYGAGVSKAQSILLNRYFTIVVRALDNDDAGRQADGVVESMLSRLGCPSVKFSYAQLFDDEGNPAKDPGDVSSNESLRAAWERSQRVMA
jgi:DNA primase